MEHLAEVAMQIRIDSSALGQIRWHDYAVRFVIGGLITSVAGIIAKEFGAGVGGLFLAFPAILPAGATLIEKHEKQKKEKAGLNGAERGREAASIDAAGSAMGSLGLMVFALLVWQFIPRYGARTVLIGATIAWLAVSVLSWLIRKRASSAIRKSQA